MNIVFCMYDKEAMLVDKFVLLRTILIHEMEIFYYIPVLSKTLQNLVIFLFSFCLMLLKM